MSRGNRDNFDARTLEELPSQPGGYQRDIFSRICLNMIRTGYHKWGFVIYRCTYDDGELWNRYLAQLKQSCHEELVKGRRAELLEKYLDWVIIEDRDKLENASRSDVRRHFDGWVSEQGLVRPPPRVIEQPDVTKLPRFRFCLYVDRQCLETVIQFQEADTGDRFFRSRLPPMVITVIDRCWTSDRTQGNVTMNDGGYPAIDGCDRKYVGWEYFNTVFVASVYNDLHGELDDYESYQRPPAIYPLGKKSMPS
ncbi:hypothetical protein K4K58_001115 [Colletotrichum sp. SAR11_239]|nr:hypothetical protein K4K58_001115 [Colletotrichum sp. SAR11_239]